MKKLIFLLGGVLGYVFGARAGRERYEQIVDASQSVWENPRVQEGRAKVQEKAADVKDAATLKAAEVKDAAVHKAGDVKDGAAAKAGQAKDAAQQKAAEVKNSSNSDSEMGQKKPHLPEPPTA